MANDEAIFPGGLIFKAPHEKAPDFIKGSLSIKVDDLVPFLKEHANDRGWVQIDLKVAKSGKYYCQLNAWKPTEEKPSTARRPIEQEKDDEIPF